MSLIGDCPCGCDNCIEPSGEEAAAMLRFWVEKERAKPATDVTPEVARLFERCAEDMEAGI